MTENIFILPQRVKSNGTENASGYCLPCLSVSSNLIQLPFLNSIITFETVPA